MTAWEGAQRAVFRHLGFSLPYRFWFRGAVLMVRGRRPAAAARQGGARTWAANAGHGGGDWVAVFCEMVHLVIVTCSVLAADRWWAAVIGELAKNTRRVMAWQPVRCAEAKQLPNRA